MVPYKRLQEERVEALHTKMSWGYPDVSPAEPGRRGNLLVGHNREGGRWLRMVRTDRMCANHRRKVAERNKAHRAMAAASRRRNRGS